MLYGEVEKIKRDFATNAILIDGQGDFTGLPGVLDVRQENSHWRLSLAQGTEPQTIFRALAARDGVKIERFELAEPSLDDIFIAVVQAPSEPLLGRSPPSRSEGRRSACVSCCWWPRPSICGW